jgi:hypothetical protein
MLLSKLTLGTTKPPTRPEEVLPMGPCSTWFHTLSVLQAKHRCSLDGSAPWVAPSPSAVGCCALVWFYCLVRVLGDANYYLLH